MGVAITRRIALTAAVVVVLGAMTPPTGATFDGRNGRIALRRYLNEAETAGPSSRSNPVVQGCVK